MTESNAKQLLETLLRAVREEIRASDSLTVSFELGDGVRVSTVSRRILYSFYLEHPPKVQEETAGCLLVNGRAVECVVISRRNDGIDVSTCVDLGEDIRSVRLTIERSELLNALGDRLESLLAGQGWKSFNADFVSKVFDVTMLSPDVSSSFVAAPEDLSEDQREAFRRVMRNEISFVWGPPGTGKTKTLSAIACDLFRRNKRVLIVSHTNRAVDSLLYSVCRRIMGRSRTALPEGSIVRIGGIAQRDLEGEFGSQIRLDLLSELQRKKLSERVEFARKEKEKLLQELLRLREQLDVASRLEVLREELVGLQRMLAEARASESSLATILRTLRIRYGAASSRKGSVDDIRRSMRTVSHEIVELAGQLNGTSLEEISDDIKERERCENDLTEAIEELERLGVDAKASTITRARLVGCTTTQAVLRLSTLRDFDAVVFDEGSMIPLPFVALLAGQAKEKIVIGGDFRQLPPISLAESDLARAWYGRDIFEAAGVIDGIDAGKDCDAVAMLTTQFRGHQALTDCINDRFYGGKLKALRKDSASAAATLGWLPACPIVVIDSSASGAVGAIDHGSKWNPTHAALAREVCLVVSKAELNKGVDSVGVIAPYRAQVTAIEDLLRDAGLDNVSVGTAHRFQGAERDTIILDLTDSSPHEVGPFLGATSLRDVGAKLLNVSLSRARERLVVIANLGFLREKLTPEHVLSGVLDDLSQRGVTVDSRDITSRGPDVEESREPHRQQVGGI